MTPEDRAQVQRDLYRASCTHYRKGSVVHTVDGSVVFNGRTDLHVGCNAAKRYIRHRAIRSFTVKD